MVSAGVAFGAAPGSPRAQAQALVAQIDAHPADKKLASEFVARAKDALNRANGARSAGDVAHGEELESLALEWAEAARDLVHTAQVERQAAALQKQAADAAHKAIRAQALLEEALARRGRAKAKLKQLEPNKREPARHAKPQREHDHGHKVHQKHPSSRGKP